MVYTIHRAVFAISIGLGLSFHCFAGAEGPIDRNYTGPVNDLAQVCMVKRTVQAHTSYTHDFQGKTYHFCCTNCLTKFQAEPDKLKWAADPVNGKAVDKADAIIYSYKGHAYFFQSSRNQRKFAKKPGKYLANYSPEATGL